VYEDTLKFMISVRKVSVNYLNNPINVLRKQINTDKKKLGEAERDYWRGCLGINASNRGIAQIREGMSKTIQRREDIFEKELGVYKDTARFRNFFARE
jgi:hypothetical protein